MQHTKKNRRHSRCLKPGSRSPARVRSSSSSVSTVRATALTGTASRHPAAAVAIGRTRVGALSPAHCIFHLHHGSRGGAQRRRGRRTARARRWAARGWLSPPWHRRRAGRIAAKRGSLGAESAVDHGAVGRAAAGESDRCALDNRVGAFRQRLDGAAPHDTDEDAAHGYISGRRGEGGLEGPRVPVRASPCGRAQPFGRPPLRARDGAVRRARRAELFPDQVGRQGGPPALDGADSRGRARR